MSFDVFISYSWSSEKTRIFAHSLAAHLRAVGFNVGIDMNLDYGDSLSGFMNNIIDSKHVLLLIDTFYVDRADSKPDSGVAIENKYISEVLGKKPESWLSVAFLENNTKLPAWLTSRNPKGFSFHLSESCIYGSEQIEDLWRWIADLPADKKNAVSPSVIRSRLERIERIENLRDSSSWVNPYITGVIKHNFLSAPSNTFTLGCGSYSFGVMFTTRSPKSVYLYNDAAHSVGLIPEGTDVLSISADDACRYLIPGRTVVLNEGQGFVIMNNEGVLLVGTAKQIVCYKDPLKEKDSFAEFEYKILLDE